MTHLERGTLCPLAGDTCRATLLNMSAVLIWFHVSAEPTSAKRRSVLIFPFLNQCRLSDIDLSSMSWARDIKHAKSDGAEEHVVKDAPVGRVFRACTGDLAKMSGDERAQVLAEIAMWGELQALTDELISTWIFDSFGEE